MKTRINKTICNIQYFRCGLIMCIILLLTFAGCSSLPKGMETRSLSFAALKMKYARDAQKAHDYTKALLLYTEAYQLYTGVDDIRGKIESGLSIARQFHYLDKPEETQKWISKTDEMIRNNMPELKTLKDILLIEIAFGKEDFNTVISIAGNTTTSNPEHKAEILCYHIASLANLKQDYKLPFSLLLNLLPSLEKKFKKNNMDDPEILSLSYYYLGYITSHIEKNWRKGIEFFEKARHIDRLLDNSYGIGKDLFALGRCMEELGMKQEAIGNYNRAAEVFLLLNDLEMEKKAKSRAIQIASGGQKPF